MEEKNWDINCFCSCVRVSLFFRSAEGFNAKRATLYFLNSSIDKMAFSVMIEHSSVGIGPVAKSPGNAGIKKLKMVPKIGASVIEVSMTGYLCVGAATGGVITAAAFFLALFKALALRGGGRGGESVFCKSSKLCFLRVRISILSGIAPSDIEA